MGTYKLRSYIAPAAPATRAPCDGTESPLRIEFGFTPQWYRQSLGIDFSERWHLDPFYRRETILAMRRELNRRFPSLNLGGANPEDAPGSIDAVHGGVWMARIFGIDVQYFPGNWPAAHNVFLTPKQVAALEVPALPNVPVFAQVLDQIDQLSNAFGKVTGYLNWQGVINNAFRLRGPDIFSDLLADPPLANHLFEVITQTMIDGMRIVYARQRETGFEVRHATVSNCVVNMVSPDTYRDAILPFDLTIRGAFEGFGVHNCAWNVDPYIEAYASIPNLGYVDMGLESDLVRVRELCPEARRAIMYTPMDLANKSINELRADLERIHRELGPCDIVMADIDPTTPDERVLAFAKLADEVVARQ
ncbi:MAG: hypothetical protein RBU21_07810 [FCB group bacterium]|jgi:hypothetical protein|nr:hypothetical protein [FCB group bacterium]